MSLTPWLDLAKKYLGQHEILGSKDNQFILDCFKHTSYHAGHDEAPWCAAFVCRVLDESGYESTHNAGAISFEHFGIPCELKPGAICVFNWDGKGERHVTICDHIVDKNYAVFIGGNQSDMVKFSVYPINKIESIRWPKVIV